MYAQLSAFEWKKYKDTVGKQSNVDRIYANLKDRISHFEIKPDEKLVETEIAKQLCASRTPLREALNRLVAEGFLTFKKDRGFSCRTLHAEDILNLYQAREAIECKIVELACTHAENGLLQKLRSKLLCDESRYHETSPAQMLVKTDEAFHMQLAELSNNSELIRMLTNLNDRLQFIRTIDLEDRRVVTPKNHMDIIDAIIEGNTEKAVSCMRAHIVRSRKEATEAVKKAYTRIYVPNPPNPGINS